MSKKYNFPTSSELRKTTTLLSKKSKKEQIWLALVCDDIIANGNTWRYYIKEDGVIIITPDNKCIEYDKKLFFKFCIFHINDGDIYISNDDIISDDITRNMIRRFIAWYTWDKLEDLMAEKITKAIDEEVLNCFLPGVNKNLTKDQ